MPITVLKAVSTSTQWFEASTMAKTMIYWFNSPKWNPSQLVDEIHIFAGAGGTSTYVEGKNLVFGTNITPLDLFNYAKGNLVGLGLTGTNLTFNAFCKLLLTVFGTKTLPRTLSYIEFDVTFVADCNNCTNAANNTCPGIKNCTKSNKPQSHTYIYNTPVNQLPVYDAY